MCTSALLRQACADGWSGNGGVAKSGSQPGSGSVAGLPSPAASWIAVTGRQKRQWYLSFQQPMTPSAMAMFAVANKRALSALDKPRSTASVFMTPFQSPGPLVCQKRAASVWSGVRVVLVSDPTSLTSLKSSA